MTDETPTSAEAFNAYWKPWEDRIITVHEELNHKSTAGFEKILAELAKDERKAFWDTAVNGEH